MGDNVLQYDLCYKTLSPIFFAQRKNGEKMKSIDFKSLDEAIDCYGRENLVAIDCIKQIIFYTRHGCQPKFVWEKETKPGQITAWFLKNETNYVYKKWMANPNGRR